MLMLEPNTLYKVFSKGHSIHGVDLCACATYFIVSQPNIIYIEYCAGDCKDHVYKNQLVVCNCHFYGHLKTVAFSFGMKSD